METYLRTPTEVFPQATQRGLQAPLATPRIEPDSLGSYGPVVQNDRNPYQYLSVLHDSWVPIRCRRSGRRLASASFRTTAPRRPGRDFGT